MSRTATTGNSAQPHTLVRDVERFADFGGKSAKTTTTVSGHRVPVFTNEFWTSKQRAAHSLHEISYRACFKPQLPRFFTERLSQPGEVVFDPFMGRGTTLLEAALLGRTPWGCDLNPLCAALVRPRLTPPTVDAVAERLRSIRFDAEVEPPESLHVFYHPETLREICALRHHLAARRSDGDFDAVDGWIQMVALNRLTGHSAGFFSVYTLPPNQAVSLESQQKINARLKQTPPRREVPRLILTKTASLLADFTHEQHATLAKAGRTARLLVGDAERTPEFGDASVALAVTSPPFLNVVDYAADNWLRNWFLGLHAEAVSFSNYARLLDWQAKMRRVFGELHRVLRPGGHVAFEVGEVNARRVNLEDTILPCGLDAGFEPVLVLLNSQQFTKTANCWGVANNTKGTNTNRVVVFRKP
jgi:hypothetical protein